MANTEVIIAGAGPTGLSAALFLSDCGVNVQVLERAGEVATDPRAATFHPPTLEMLAPSGVTDELHRRGLVVRKWQAWDRKLGLTVEFDLGVLALETAYPYRLQCEQHKLVEILKAKLSERANVSILHDCAAESVSQDADKVTVKTKRGDFSADFLIGADGGRSAVRKSLGIAFNGFTYPERFLVITTNYDFEAEGYALSCYIADPEEWCALFKVPGEDDSGVWRSVFPTSPDLDDATLLSLDFAQQKMDRLLPRKKAYKILHANLYNVHQRVAERFVDGRVLLIGDAAHVNNPLGGMGMNFGVHDAKGAAEALCGILRSQKPMSALDVYDRRRRGVANAYLQAMTIENKKALEEKSPEAAEARRQNLRRLAADPELARSHLMRTSMIEGLRAAEKIG